MALRAVVDSLDGVPETLHEFYEESPDGGGYKLRVDGHFADASGLKVVNSDLKKEVGKLRKRLKAFDGLDTDEIAQMRSRLEDMEEQEASKKGDYDRALSARDTRHQKELKKLQDRAEKLHERLVKVMKQDAALVAINEHEGIAAALQHQVEQRIDLVEDEDDVRVVVRGLDGAELESASDLVKQMKDSEDFRWGFRPNGATGGGASGRRGGSATGKSISDMTEQEKMDYIEEHGAESYQKKLVAETASS